MKKENKTTFMEEEHIVELFNENGEPENWLHIATVDYKGELYCVFQKAEPETEEEEDEAVIYKLDEKRGMLDPIEDDYLLDEVFAEYCHQYEATFGSDEAELLD